MATEIKKKDTEITKLRQELESATSGNKAEVEQELQAKKAELLALSTEKGSLDRKIVDLTAQSAKLQSELDAAKKRAELAEKEAQAATNSKAASDESQDKLKSKQDKLKCKQQQQNSKERMQQQQMRKLTLKKLNKKRAKNSRPNSFNC